MLNLHDYITQSRLFKTIEVEDLMLVEYKCLVEEHQSDIWAHRDYFAYVMGGEKRWETPLNSCKVGPGQVLFVRKGATTVYQYFDRPFFVIFLFISEEFIRKVLKKYPHLVIDRPQVYLDNDQLVPLELNSVLSAYFHSLGAYFTNHVKINMDVIQLKIEELILDILIQPGNQSLKQHFFRLLDRRKSDLRELMMRNFQQPFSIPDYARFSGRSLSTFRRDFRREFNTTPGKWLLKKRLEHSRFLLDTTEDRISEILFASGFSNRAHFNKAFKNHFGQTPNEYRRKPVVW